MPFTRIKDGTHEVDCRTSYDSRNGEDQPVRLEGLEARVDRWVDRKAARAIDLHAEVNQIAGRLANEKGCVGNNRRSSDHDFRPPHRWDCSLVLHPELNSAVALHCYIAR